MYLCIMEPKAVTTTLEYVTYLIPLFSKRDSYPKKADFEIVTPFFTLYAMEKENVKYWKMIFVRNIFSGQIYIYLVSDQNSNCD